MKGTMTHNEAINLINDSCKDSRFMERRWHYDNWRIDHPLVMLIRGVSHYADQHARRYESPIGEDGVLGQEWATAVRAVRGLLNGELGGLDGGTLDKMLCGMLRQEGFEA